MNLNRYKILDKNGVEMPLPPHGKRRTYDEANKLIARLNVDGEFRPYTIVPEGYDPKLSRQFLEARGEDFVVFYKPTGLDPFHKMSWEGEVYPIMPYGDGEEEFDFMDENASDPQPDRTKARRFFVFSFCWRGVWEGRVYPKREEYMEDDVHVMSDLWRQIETLMKKQIKKDNPDYGHFED